MGDGAGVADAAKRVGTEALLMSLRFTDKLEAIQQANQSDILLLIAPRLAKLPLPMQRYDDPFLPYGRVIIEATRDLVCGYVFDLAAYLALGAAGAIALERTIPFARPDLITVLHGPFSGPDYSAAAFEEAFNCDAVTLVDDVNLEAYLTKPERGAFVVQRGMPRTDHLHGVYWTDVRLFTYPQGEDSVIRLRLADEKVLYAGHGENFTDAVRAALERMRHE